MVQFSKKVIVETIIFGGENCTKNLKPIHRCATIKANSGLLAQRLEQGTHNPLVAGSNPAGPTKGAFECFESDIRQAWVLSVCQIFREARRRKSENVSS